MTLYNNTDLEHIPVWNMLSVRILMEVNFSYFMVIRR
jgi:hypothetical protein